MELTWFMGLLYSNSIFLSFKIFSLQNSQSKVDFIEDPMTRCGKQCIRKCTQTYCNWDNFPLDLISFLLCTAKMPEKCLCNLLNCILQEYTSTSGSSRYKSNGESKHRNGGSKLQQTSTTTAGGLSRTVNNSEPYRTELR